MKQQTILVVDDETTVREVVRRYLERDGFKVLEAANGTQALNVLRVSRPDLIVLDIMLPELDGFGVMRAVRNPNGQGDINPDTPVIMLTARTEEEDRIAGFEYGADDYVVKPFSPQELAARVKAVLRRSATSSVGGDEPPLIFPHLRLDPRSRSVTVKDMPVTLTAKEFDLLWFFARHPGQVFTRPQLLDQVWGFEFYGDESTVTVHIRRLREKIEPDTHNPTYLQTVWGVGYKFEPTS